MFGATGAGLSKFRNWQNGGKRARRSLDQWDRQSTKKYNTSHLTMTEGRLIRYLVVMNRDRRLTGFLRGQSDAPIAPAGFELNNPWRVRFPKYGYRCIHKTYMQSRLRGASHRLEKLGEQLTGNGWHGFQLANICTEITKIQHLILTLST